jgi:bifunctional non-homologous end joining protein LigD
MSLEKYRSKRDFGRTPEPSGEPEPGGNRADASSAARPAATAIADHPTAGGRFVVQRHRARQLHYDFRLEVDGVLASWAVPKGPSLDSSVRRAAFRVEDHPLDYYDFEGTIPKGEYGGGDVIVWDWGMFEPEETADPGDALRKGELKLVLHGDKLRGRFTLVRTKGFPGGRDERESWLLIKKRDDWAVAGWDAETHLHSVKTGRTNDEVKAGVAATETRTGPAAESPAAAAPAPASAAGSPPAAAKAAEMPGFIEPMTATLADGPFSDPDWLFEVKWDGYRVQAHVRDGRVALYTRRGLDAASYFPELAGPPTWIDARQAIVDGEVVALNEKGEPDFGLLQARKRAGRGRSGGEAASLAYVVFDLLYLDGHLLLDQPLEARKQLLRQVIHDSGPVQYASHVEGDGKEFYDAVADRGLEGIMAKLRRSRYESGRRSPAWLKIKRRSEQEFAVGGWSPREGSETDLGALVVGVYDNGRLRPVGKVGTGFDARERSRLLELMAPLETQVPAFHPVPRDKGVRWVEPRLVARVEFAEWTSDGNLRAPSYKGLEIDADPMAVVRELPRSTREARRDASAAVATPVVPKGPPASTPAATRPPAAISGSGSPAESGGLSAEELAALDGLPAKGGLWSFGGRQLKLSNLDKLLWPDDGITKRDLIRYNAAMAPYVLPYLRNRALTLQRYPDGIGRTGFWQKQVPAYAPDWIDCWPWRSKATSESTDYLLAGEPATLAWAGNEAAIDIHPSTFEIGAPERPTWALVDIDPGRQTTWDEVLLLARLYRTALDHLGLKGFAKLSGQRGIQVWIPIRPSYSFDETRDWVAALSRTVAGAAPNLVSWKWEKASRDGLARLDYTQNAWNKTLVAPYSVRPVAGAPVSAPIAWDELEDPELRPDRWTLRTILGRLSERGDLFAPALGLEQELPKL